MPQPLPKTTAFFISPKCTAMSFSPVSLCPRSHGFKMTSLLSAAISHATLAYLVTCMLDHLPVPLFPTISDRKEKMLLSPIPDAEPSLSVPIDSKPRIRKAKTTGLSGVVLVTIFYVVVLAVLCLFKRLSPEWCLLWGYSYLIALVGLGWTTSWTFIRLLTSWRRSGLCGPRSGEM